jgi:glycosyltransferase involved in cell wall biosynthesis
VATGKARARAPAHSTGERPGPTDVLIVEEYIPEYRRRFFELLEAALAPESIRLTVAAGPPSGAGASRGDAAAELPFVRRVPAPSVSVAGRRLTFRRLSALAHDSSLVVVDQALRHLENYPLLLRQRRGPKVALWGHGTRHAKPATRVERLLERRVTRLAHWFFAYTQRGADHVAAAGFPAERITVVQNTFDVGELTKLRKGVSPAEQQRLRDELRLPARNVCLYIGALDPSKRVGFLLEACSTVASRIPDFALVVAGEGPERGVVEAATGSSPWLRYVGRATGAQKARLGAVSDVLLMPGSVGLVAVDSFALETPIVTTRWPYHGPEMDYLEDGVNARISGYDVSEFARTVEEVLLAPDELTRLKSACAAASARYSLENMVTKFAGGVIAALRTPRR